MTEERKRVLEMVRDGIISIEEGEELLRVLKEAEDNESKPGYKFKAKLKEDLERTKIELLKAKEKFVNEYAKIDMAKVKSKIKKGIDTVDSAVGKVDEAILKFGEKIVNINVDIEESETLDPMEDENISFYGKDEK